MARGERRDAPRPLLPFVRNGEPFGSQWNEDDNVR